MDIAKREGVEAVCPPPSSWCLWVPGGRCPLRGVVSCAGAHPKQSPHPAQGPIVYESKQITGDKWFR